MDIGNIIRLERKAKGLSIEALARKADVSCRTILNIEKGHNAPTFSIAEKVLEVLELEITITKKED